jgi:hypothetical protein
VSGEVSWFSRFFGKFTEVIAIGLATAASGYLVAHLGGLLSSPAPTAIQIAPTAGGVSGKPLAEPIPPVSAEAKEQRVAPPAPLPAQRTVSTAKAVPPPKHMKTDTTATESKPRDEKSVEARVRAALANIDANPSAPPVVPPYQANVGPGPAALGAQPRPVDGPFAVDIVPVVPRAADQPRPLQQAPVQHGPLTAVERKSPPVAAVQVLPVPYPAPVEENNGFSASGQIISDTLPPYPPPEPTGEVPRPPMPVGR